MFVSAIIRMVVFTFRTVFHSQGIAPRLRNERRSSRRFPQELFGFGARLALVTNVRGSAIFSITLQGRRAQKCA